MKDDRPARPERQNTAPLILTVPFQACDRRHLEKLRPLAHAIPPPEWETALRHHPGPSSTPEGSTDA